MDLGQVLAAFLRLLAAEPEGVLSPTQDQPGEAAAVEPGREME
jgi:hypothetical protein